MLIIACFTDTGLPKTGLSPIINVWKSDGALVVDEQIMVERAGGFYDYDFSSYDNNENYVFRADGGLSLSDYDRYVYGTNDVSDLAKMGEYDTTLSGIQAGLSNIETCMFRALGLMQENQYLDQTNYITYRGVKLLTSGRLRIYSVSGSVGTDSDIIATYNIISTWNGDELNTYKVTKV